MRKIVTAAAIAALIGLSTTSATAGPRGGHEEEIEVISVNIGGSSQSVGASQTQTIGMNRSQGVNAPQRGGNGSHEVEMDVVVGASAGPGNPGVNARRRAGDGSVRPARNSRLNNPGSQGLLLPATPRARQRRPN